MCANAHQPNYLLMMPQKQLLGFRTVVSYFDKFVSDPGHLQKLSTNPRVVLRSSGFLPIFSLKFVQKGGKGKER